jgi:hypothetical protein
MTRAVPFFRLRRRLARALLRLASFLAAGALALLGCGWARATLSDEAAPAPLTCGPRSCPGEDCFRGVCEPFDRASRRDAEPFSLERDAGF